MSGGREVKRKGGVTWVVEKKKKVEDVQRK